MRTPTRFDPQALTSLGRSIDPAYPSNRAAIVGSVFAALIVAAAGLTAEGTLAVGPISAGGSVFLSWAIARELDPDHPISAMMAMPIAFGLLIVLGEPSLLLGAAVLLGARMISGTVGEPLRAIDIAGLVLLATLLGLQGTTLVGVPLLITGVVVGERSTWRGFAIGAAVALAAGSAFVVSGAEVVGAAPGPASWVGIALTVLTTFAAVPAARPRATTDLGGQDLSSTRLNAARIAVALTILSTFAIAGDPTVAAMAPAGAAMVAVAIRRIAMRSTSARALVHR